MRVNDIKNFLQIIIFILASLIGKAILKALKGIGLISHPFERIYLCFRTRWKLILWRN